MINGNFDANGFDVSASVLQSAPGTIFTSGVNHHYSSGLCTKARSTIHPVRMLYASNFLQHTVWIVFICSAAATFRDITVMNDGLSFLLADVNCRVLTAYGDMAYGGYLTANNIQKLIAFGNLTLQNNNVDTLYLNNPGKQSTWPTQLLSAVSWLQTELLLSGFHPGRSIYESC